VDAWNYDLEVRPHEAYNYAFGGTIELPLPGGETYTTKIDRPLDFMAVTDHAEFMGEQRLCADESSPVYDSETCAGIRSSIIPMDNPLALDLMNPWTTRNADVCGDDGKLCKKALSSAWQETIAAARAWNDTTTACEHTTFIAYEYSSLRLGSNLHRNVIFAGNSVPKLPVSYIDVQREWELWELLESGCKQAGTNCDVLSIPHNSNISNGRMFKTDYPGTTSVEEQAARARLQAAMEPLVEVMQHKGDSECGNGIPNILGGNDEFCDFEKMEMVIDPQDEFGGCYQGPLADWLPHLGMDCISHSGYTRYALIEGLAEEARIGVNPFKFGLMASTDTHNGTGGNVRERDWTGHLGIADVEKKIRLDQDSRNPGNLAMGPGGLIGVYAEENSRQSIFDAMRRREVFGTSGTRIRPRFFGGWDIPKDLCSDPDRLARADKKGVPMGADLPKAPDRRAPQFAVFAERDPGTAEAPGDLLQRIQIIKGWVDKEGMHQQVIDVAGGPNGAGVDTASCEVYGPGEDSLCGVWEDPDFDPDSRAVYYARVLENPSCRYSAWQCIGLEGASRPPSCEEPRLGPTQQERAWTSPIWYTPIYHK